MDQCSHCQAILSEQRVLLDRRIEVMTFSGETPSTIVLGCDDSHVFCSQECWQQHQLTIIEQLKLIQTFPLFSVISDCCRCGVPVDRRKAYVMYALMEGALKTKPWLKTFTVQSDVEFAVLCQQCEFPNFEEADQELEVRAPELNQIAEAACEKVQ
jgi:NAD-dependent dihydropyrimidine dehydrogenase PreA subunit